MGEEVKTHRRRQRRPAAADGEETIWLSPAAQQQDFFAHESFSRRRRRPARRRRIQPRRNVVFLLWPLLLGLLASSTFRASGFSDTSITFDPAVPGIPLEITFSFTLNYDILAASFIHLRLSGITSGGGTGTVGAAIGSETSRLLAIWEVNSSFTGYYTEGTPSAEYYESAIHLYAAYNYYAGDSFNVTVDRSNELVSNCGHLEGAGGFTLYSDSAAYVIADTSGTTHNTFSWNVSSVAAIAGACYLETSEVNYFPARPGRSVDVNVTFTPARNMTGGDVVTVVLPGITSGYGNGTAGSDIAMGSVTLSTGDDNWEAQWTEGTYVKDNAGFANSTLTLRLLPNATVTADSAETIIVAHDVGLRAQCGLPADNEANTFTVNSTSALNWSYVAQPASATGAVGIGCGNLNSCSKRGVCDHCLQRCTCPTGFGAADDVVDADIAPDCSEYICPAGRAWSAVNVRAAAARVDPTGAGHAVVECSGVGVCTRTKGQCVCPKGFAGPACERLPCRNSCSGHGKCLPMRQLARIDDALPLLAAANATDVEYGAIPGAGATWDSASLYGCVCESSWDVGLASGQTQQSEWFGPDCSLHRCPSGENPDTLKNETDCGGVAAAGGFGVGAAGNLCHVDCSNRGVCNYATGVCACFDGYYGAACALSSALAKGQTA